MKKNIKTKNSGFVLLFAVTLASMLLAVALGVSNIALKELNFSTSARDSNEAFFVADLGSECALFNDQISMNKFPIAGPATQITCAGTTTTPTFSGTASTGSYDFKLVNLGSLNQSCVSVNVYKENIGSSSLMNTTIASKGYNVGDASCNSAVPSRIERELDVKYGTHRNVALGKSVSKNGVPDASPCTVAHEPSCLTNGTSDFAGQAWGGSSWSYEVDLQSLITLSAINVVLCSNTLSPGDNGCYGFNYKGVDGIYGNLDDTPYINSWSIQGWNGSSWQNIPNASGAVPNTKNIVVFPTFPVSKIKFIASSTVNTIGVYELEAY